MLDYLLLMLLIMPFIGAGAIVFLSSQSLLSGVLVLAGAIVGAILITVSGLVWLRVLHREWMESQPAGFIFVPVILPFLAYTGAVAGTSLVAILGGYSRNYSSSCLFQAIAICLTVVLAGLMSSILLTLDLSRVVRRLLIVPFAAMGAGVVSSSLASQLAHLFADRFI
ncbi:MAG: hypothetical protein MUC48_18425 [Leptolyngbya sp. Prado105]|jgi:hypothetical protein|nr:hypothetical protein [Leptolyngbya sp. Prado105]